MNKPFTLKSICLSFLLLIGSGGLAMAHDHGKTDQPINFIENKGQWNSEARFKANIPGGTLFLTDNGFVYHYLSSSDMEVFQQRLEDGKEPVENGIRHHAYKVKFVGANANPAYSGSDRRSFYHNYLIGNDASKWASHVGVYGGVSQKGVYDGIDLKVYSSGVQSLKYDFVVAPGADVTQIKLLFEGVRPLLSEDGDLLIKTSVNEIIEQAPVTYQEINGKRVIVKSAYKLTGGALSFVFPDGYNQSYPLVIDPNLIFATYSGGSSDYYYAHSTTYDELGATYASALAYGAGWPTTTGAFQTTYPGSNSVALNKYSSDGSLLEFSTYFGGASGSTQPNTVRITDNFEVVLAGSTTASDLPVTTGAYQATFGGGGNDIYVAKLSADGSTMIACTYLGGSGIDGAMIGSSTTYSGLGSATNPRNPVEVAFDDAGNVWVASNSNSTNFPVTASATQSTNGGGFDAIISQLTGDLTGLIYSSYCGGSQWDGGIGLEMDPSGNFVMVGMTESANFPTTAGALHPTSNGGEDGFAVKINGQTGGVIAATFLGTSATDDAERVDFDCAGNVFVAGRSLGGTYPVTPGAWNTPNGYVYVHKLTPDLSATIYSTKFGASTTSIVPSAFMVDMCGNAVVGTVTSSSAQSGMPLTSDAFQTSPSPFYLCIISTHFDELEFGSYFGTNSDHFHPGVARLDKNGLFYQSVCSTSPSFPVTSGSYSPIKQNGSSNDCVTFKFNFDVAVIKMEQESFLGANDTVPHCIRGCKSAFFNFKRKHADTIPLTIRYLINGSAVNGVDYEFIPDSIVIPANDTMATLEIKPLLVNNMPTGVKDVVISALSPCGCEDGTDNVVAEGTILIYDSLYVDIPTMPQTVCANTEVEITAEIDSTLNFDWEPKAFIPDPYPLGLTIHPKPVQTTSFTITVTQPGAPATCPSHSATYVVNVEPYPQVMLPTRDTTICINPGDSTSLNVYAEPGGINYSYHWTPSDYLRDDYSPNNKFAAPVGDYQIVVSATTPEANCSSQDSMMIHVVPPFDITSVSPVDTTIEYGDVVELDVRGDAVTWLWMPVSYLDDPTLQNPVAAPEETMDYFVVGWDVYGCRDTAEVHIEVLYPTTVGMPNAFSPNGDGLNDVFKIENLQHEKMVDFKIFNRYGQLVFEAKDPEKGWDGTFNNQPAPMDTYFYMVRIVLPDGTHKTFKGDLSLIR